MSTERPAERPAQQIELVALERVVELWMARPDVTLQEVADALGLTRQDISKRLIRAGYSPKARLDERRSQRRISRLVRQLDAELDR